MKQKDFNPHARFCAQVLLCSDYARAARAYDYRLFYVLEGGFTAQFEDRAVEVAAGGLLMIPPGVPYRLLPGKYQKSNHIIVNFDFVSDFPDREPQTIFDAREFREEAIYTRACISPFEEIFHLPNARFCAVALHEMREEMRQGDGASAAVVSGLLKTLLARLSREAGRARPREEDAGDALCRRVREYVGEHYTEPIDNAAVARAFGYHPYYLNTLFKKKTGGTLHAYMTELRLARAEELLLSTDASVAEIGERCGIRGAAYFSELFLKKRGVSPTAFRRQAR